MRSRPNNEHLVVVYVPEDDSGGYLHLPTSTSSENERPIRISVSDLPDNTLLLVTDECRLPDLPYAYPLSWLSVPDSFWGEIKTSKHYRRSWISCAVDLAHNALSIGLSKGLLANMQIVRESESLGHCMAISLGFIDKDDVLQAVEGEGFADIDYVQTGSKGGATTTIRKPLIDLYTEIYDQILTADRVERVTAEQVTDSSLFCLDRRMLRSSGLLTDSIRSSTSKCNPLLITGKSLRFLSNATESVFSDGYYQLCNPTRNLPAINDLMVSYRGEGIVPGHCLTILCSGLIRAAKNYGNDLMRLTARNAIKTATFREALFFRGLEDWSVIAWGNGAVVVEPPSLHADLKFDDFFTSTSHEISALAQRTWAQRQLFKKHKRHNEDVEADFARRIHIERSSIDTEKIIWGLS